MTDILPEIEKRRARRAIRPERIPAEVVERLLRAATLAPSCFNYQPWRFLVVEEEQALQKVRAHLAEGNYWAKKSPLLVLVLTKPDLDCRSDDRREYAIFDVGQATGYLTLQATREGLIAHPIAGFKPIPIKTDLGVPEDYILVTLVVIGLPGDESVLNEKHLAQEHGERSRKSLEEVVMRNRWRPPSS